MNGIKNIKADLREKIRTLRRDIFTRDSGKYSVESRLIVDRIVNFPFYRDASDIISFYPKTEVFEPDITPVMEYSVKVGKRIYLPRCIVEIFGLEFVRISDIRSQLGKGAYGIMEPLPELKAEPPFILYPKIGLVIVPGMAFDRKGNRLGYGAAYYDRFLREFRKYNREAPVVGVAFDFQIIESGIPGEPHDCRVDFIITPSEIINTHR